MLQREIYSVVPSNKTAQQNSQHCTKLHIKVHKEERNVLQNNITEKMIFFVFYFCKIDKK